MWNVKQNWLTKHNITTQWKWIKLVKTGRFKYNLLAVLEEVIVV